MLELLIPQNLTRQFERALDKAGDLECGGVLLAEHVGENVFVLREITVQGTGTISRFVRKVGLTLRGVHEFFSRHQNDYVRFNYLGEWHSHPLFVPEPSSVDHASMQEIILDESLGANFVVLLVVKLDERKQLIGSAHVYLPSGFVHRATLNIER